MYPTAQTFVLFEPRRAKRRSPKARAAAHTTNGFVALDDFRFEAGAAQAQLYRLPGARYFGQAFCTGSLKAAPPVRSSQIG